MDKEIERKYKFSFEVFPPKQSTSFDNIKKVTDNLLELKPDFISVTYGAGGTAKDNRTVEVCRLISESGKRGFRRIQWCSSSRII